MQYTCHVAAAYYMFVYQHLVAGIAFFQCKIHSLHSKFCHLSYSVNVVLCVSHKRGADEDREIGGEGEKMKRRKEKKRREESWTYEVKREREENRREGSQAYWISFLVIFNVWWAVGLPFWKLDYILKEEV